MTMTAGPVPFGPFELLAPLGGGMGVVYRARRVDDGTELAVKLLRRERLLDGEARERFAREVRALHQLTHPSICPLLDAGEVDGMPYLCMPLLRGSTLGALLARARERAVPLAALLPGASSDAPPWQPVVALFARLADALDFAHRRGFVHRDVKPANLWVDPHGQPLLLDFGLTRGRDDRYRDLTRTGQVVGTPTYLSPEQLDARIGPVDGRSDVYGLAAVLFEALALEPPFHAATRLELFTAILRGIGGELRSRLAGVPTALATLLVAALARDPACRPPTAGAFAADLRRVLAGGQPLTRRPGWRHRLADQLRRNPGQTTLTAAVLASAALAAAITLHGREDAALARQRADVVAMRQHEGRLALAREQAEALPPPWPRHAAVLAAWLREQGEPLAAAPADVAAATPGLREFVATTVPAVRRRLAAATAAAARVERDAATWRHTLDELARDARFQGLARHEQPGLIPLGPDPRSGLQEFYDPASGRPDLDPPRRDADGRLEFLPQHGVVFVLLPGGTIAAGDGSDVPIAPFLCAKHELTRAQHRQLALDHDPSRVPLGLWNGEMQTLRHPVDRVAFTATLALLRAWGSDLPTNLQWQYAATAGDAAAAAAQAGNLDGAEDGHRIAAPVGSFDPNAFGLCDIVGNMAEWVLDAAGTQSLPARPGDGLRGAAPQQDLRLVRGTSYGNPPQGLGAPQPWRDDDLSGTVGVRPIRPWLSP